MNFVPSADQFSQLMSQATAPAFVLGAVAAFIAILLGRLTLVIDRIRSLNAITDGDVARGHLKEDIPRLRQRAKLLNSATHLALISGICTSFLLVLGFASAFFKLPHEFGAGGLFVAALCLLGVALFRFSQEVRMGISEADHYQ
jgi:Protein of unknown function (DUF2721)